MAAATDNERLCAQAETECELSSTLKACIKEHEKRECEYVKWEERLRHKKRSIEDNIVNCDDIVRQTDAKHLLATENAKRDIENQENSVHVIEDLRRKLIEIRDENHRTTMQIQHGKKYFEYLSGSIQTVLSRKISNNEDVYELVEEILSRHQTLSSTNEQLRRQYAATLRTHDEKMHAHGKYVDASRETILALKTRLGGMKRTLESNVRNKSANLTTARHYAKKCAFKHTSVSLIKLAAENMFSQCVQRSFIGRGCQDSIEARLTVIGHYLRDIRELLDNEI